jgi:PmbA protein
VRLGEPELVEEAGHHSVSLRVIRDQRVAVTATSDLSEAGLLRCVADALELSELSEADPFAGPADPSELAKPPFADLEMFDPAVGAIDAAEALRRATLAERVALGHDGRIGLSEGATFARSEGVSALVFSSGFEATLRGSYASLAVAPVAEDEGGKKRRGHYWTGARHAALLEDPESVGREAARRTLDKLGAKKIATTEAPVVFDPDVARGLVGSFAGCIVGGSIWRKASYLMERDGEGLASRRNQVVEAGVLKTFLCDWYSARKLGRRSTASAGRSGGSVGPTTTNFILAAGTTPPEAIVASTARGLYVTELMGFGFNPVTGDFSRGASGFWIENGARAFPVSEITISSTLDAMLKGIDAIGTDLVLKTSTAAPTLRISNMTISGN